MRTSDFRFSSSNDATNVRFPIQFFPFPSQNQNIYYQTPMALHLTPNQITNGSHLNNNVIFPPIYQLGNPHFVVALPCATNNLAENNNISNQASVESHLNQSITSPTLISPTNQLSINFSLSKWNEIAPFFVESNNDIRPSAGQLRNGKYFTQRSAGKDIYMVFNSKSDYINNFVNYYFSNKNFSTDEKLYNLMDDLGCVALSDLMKFPRLAQIGTTIDDIIEALKFSKFVVIVNLKNETKGIRRLDGWFPSKLIDDSQISVTSQWTTTINNNDSSASFHKVNPDVYRSMLNTNNNSMNIIIPPNPNMHDTNVVTIQSPHQDLQSKMVDTVASNNPMIYFNPTNNPIQQSIYAPAYVHGIHQSNYPSPSGATTVPPMLAQGQAPQLILNTPQHYSNPSSFQQNQSIHFRSIWQNQNLTDLNNHTYNPRNNNVRHVIGAGGNNQTNQKQCPY